MSEVGFKNPNRDFDVVAKEFTIPARVFLMDSIATSTGTILANGGAAYKMPGPQRMLVGSLNDPRFGKTTATGYGVYALGSGVYVNDNAEYESTELTVVFDYYWSGATSVTAEQQFEIYELQDSVLTYLKHYSNQPAPFSNLIGTQTHKIDPDAFDANVVYNASSDVQSNPALKIADSLHITLDENFGRRLFNAAMDTVGDHENNFAVFKKFRRNFKGFAFVAPGADKIVGMDMENAKTRLTLKYKVDTTHYQAVFYFSPPGSSVNTGEYMTWTGITSDRSGTPLAGLTTPYTDLVPSDGKMYVQSGSGVGLKLDFSGVYDYFKNIENKALSVAELKLVVPDAQRTSPFSFRLRALRADNRELKSSKTYTDLADNPYEDYDINFVSKHLVSQSSYTKPYLRADAVGDDGNIFSFTKQTGDAGTVYTGYLTSFLQQELSLPETDFLRYYALLPQSPDNARGVDGLYFPADSLKLTVYYTTPRTAN